MSDGPRMMQAHTAAQRWGENRERHLLLYGPPHARKGVPTLKEFAPRFLGNYAHANRQKPSGIAVKETVLDVHLIPLLGEKRLDGITSEQIQRVKSHLAGRSAKTVNDVLSGRRV